MSKILGIVRLSVEKRVTILMLCMIILVFGFLSLSRLGLDMLPDITFPMVSVVTQYAGVAPEEIEQFVTVPLEGVIAGVNGVKKLSSVSSEGVSAITVEFEWGTNLDFAAQDIKDNIDFIKDFLPEDMTEPIVFKFNLSQIPIMFVGVTGIDDTYKLRRLLENNVVERLQRLDGVAQAVVFGGLEREIQVALDPGKLEYRGLAISDVLQALPAQNLNLPAGYHTDTQTDFLLRSVGEFRSIDDVGDAIVGASRNGTPVKLREVATVRDTYREQRSTWLLNGSNGVFLIMNKRSGANTLQVSRKVNKELKALAGAFPQLEFITIFDQGKPVERVTSSTARNAAIGAVLAIGFMWIFLLNLRPTLAIAVAIPLSIITTFIAIYLAGFTLNLMTLGGLALGVGMLVDNAIVVIENIYRHLEHGTERREAAKVGASEVAMAITASTFTTVVVFLPLLFSEGLAGQLTKGLSVTIIFSLIASLVVALTIVPMIASVLFKERRTAETAKWFIPFRDWYTRRLSWVLDHPWITFLSTTAFLVLSLAIAVKFVGAEFMPQADNDMFMVEMEMPVGTTLEESGSIAGQVRDMMREFPEVIDVGEGVGRDENDRGGEQARITGPHMAQFFVKLSDAADRKKTLQTVQDEIRQRLPILEGTRFRFQAMGMTGGNEKPIRINVYGRSLETLEEIAATIAQVMGQIKGLRDVESSFGKGRPEYHFVVDRERALRYGLAPVQVQTALLAANLGKVVTRLRTGEEEIDIRVILDKRYRDDLERLAQLPLKTPAGTVVPLSQVVKVLREDGPPMIKRDSKYRVGTVDANLADVDLRTAVANVKDGIKGITASLPDGYRVEFKGSFEDMQETFGQLLLGLVLAIVLVYMVMASQFESLSHPFIIMFTFPLAMIGVVWALLLTGKTFSVVAFVGVIILAGIAVNNGIVLVDYVNQLRARGMGMREALIEGGRTRIRPVLITAGTTIAGMLPMALSTSEGSEMRAPMALTVIGGLFSATILTLFLIPVLYLAVDRVGNAIKGAVKKVLR